MTEHQHDEHTIALESEAERENTGTDRELRDENTATDPLEGNQLADEDQVFVDGPSKLAHEDTVPETVRQSEENETRDGSDIEGGKTARELHDERVDEAKKANEG